MNFASVDVARDIIRESKENGLTNYFGQNFSTICPEYLSLKEMNEMFRSKGFGAAETNLILASLVMAGCKFAI